MSGRRLPELLLSYLSLNGFHAHYEPCLGHRVRLSCLCLCACQVCIVRTSTENAFSSRDDRVGGADHIGFPPRWASSRKRALENALPWDHVRALRFVPARAPVQAFASARGQHEKRVKGDPGFGMLLEEVQLANEAQQKTRVSLLGSKRSQEMRESKNSQREREARIQRALGLTPAVDKEGAVDQEQAMDPSKDVLLKEAAWILSDLIVRPKFKASRQLLG
ncbi:MAG: carboxy terminal-processing peptidase [Gammaproteobacteria bacterium]